MRFVSPSPESRRGTTSDGQDVWIGSYTGDRGRGRGIYRARLGGTGEWRVLGLAAEVDSPSYLALHPHRDVLYAVIEDSDRGVAGVVAYDVLDGSWLRPAGRVPAPAGPCHLAVHPDGSAVLSASYLAGTVNAHALDAAGHFTGVASVVPGHGSGPRTDRQDGPHAHAVAIAPDGIVLSTDLGADLLRAHRLDPTGGTLDPVAEVALPAGSGPRHLVVHPAGQVIVLTELARTVLTLQPTAGYGELAVVAESPATAEPVDEASLCGAIRLGGHGRFAYTSTRGADVLTVHHVGDDGGLRALADVPCGGRWPRDFIVLGDRLHVAHEHSDSIATFRVDAQTGLLHPTPAAHGTAPSPVCVLPAAPARR